MFKYINLRKVIFVSISVVPIRWSSTECSTACFEAQKVDEILMNENKTMVIFCDQVVVCRRKRKPLVVAYLLVCIYIHVLHCRFKIHIVVIFKPMLTYLVALLPYIENI